MISYVCLDAQVRKVPRMKKLHYVVRQRFTHRGHGLDGDGDHHGNGDQTQTISVVND